jgi:hypothetical protein
MKTNTQTLMKITALAALAFLTACGTSKATDTSIQVTDSGSRVEVESTKPVASCNQFSRSNFLTINIANVLNSQNQADEQWVKIKFSNVANAINQPAYHIQIYKWRVINNSTQIDSTPLQVTSFSLASGQLTSTANSGIYVNQIDSQNGYMVKLNDDTTNPYQVMKVVAYKADGTIIDQANFLIPQFLANPEDYKLNPNGTPRADLLQKMHPLYGNDVTGWSFSQMQESFDQYCF